MIDMAPVRDILRDMEKIVDELDGLDLDERDAITASPQDRRRKQDQARLSKTLLLLHHRAELLGSMVMVEYYFARGEIDPLDIERRLPS